MHFWGGTLPHPPHRPPFAAPSHTPYAHALHADAAYALSLGRHAAETTALCFVHSSGECRIERVARAVLSVRMNGQRYHSKWGRGNDSNTIIAPIVANQFPVERKAGRTHINLKNVDEFALLLSLIARYATLARSCPGSPTPPSLTTGIRALCPLLRPTNPGHNAR